MRKRFNSLITQWVRPILKQYNFKKSRESYVSKRDFLSWYFQFQRSQWNTPDRVEFTVNVGVFVPGVVSAYVNRPQKKSISLTDCCIYARIGMLAEAREDCWWVLNIDDDANIVDRTIGLELKKTIEEYAIPFLQNFDTIQQVAEFLESTSETSKYVNPMNQAIRFAYAAILYSFVDNNLEQQAAITKAVALAKDSPIEEHVVLLKERYG